MNDIHNPANYPTYQIGDQVTIRQWDDMAAEFGLDERGRIKVPRKFTRDMKQYCGQTLPIVRISRDNPPFFDIYYLGDSTAIFSSPMFEQSCPTVVPVSTLTFDDLLQGAAP